MVQGVTVNLVRCAREGDEHGGCVRCYFAFSDDAVELLFV